MALHFSRQGLTKVVPTATSVWYQKIHLRIAILRDEDPACKLLKMVQIYAPSQKSFGCRRNSRTRNVSAGQTTTTKLQPLSFQLNFELRCVNQCHLVQTWEGAPNAMNYAFLSATPNVSSGVCKYHQHRYLSNFGSGSKAYICICARYQRKDTHVSDPSPHPAFILTDNQFVIIGLIDTEIPTKMHFHQGSDYTEEFGIGITPNPEASDQTINPETEILNRPSVSPITWLANWTHALMQLLFPPHTAV
jgi:hypothetical protein